MLSMLLHEGRDGQALKVQVVILRALTKKIYPGGNRRPRRALSGNAIPGGRRFDLRFKRKLVLDVIRLALYRAAVGQL